MKPKIIKTEAEHAAALARIEEIFTAKPGTPEGDELELLSMLVEHYEKQAFPIALPDPLSALRFRMEQQGLKPKDLIPFIGSPSKVSEVLAGKRTLSLAMIRNLHESLGIPAEVLLGKSGAKLDPDHPALLGQKFPIAEMRKRGWFADFQGTLADARGQWDELLARFAAPLGVEALRPALNRQCVRSGSKLDEFALTAWRIRVASLAIRETLPAYRPQTVTADFARELVRLSYFDAGPVLAKEFLNKAGIHLVFERHLSKTHLDGAAFKLPDESPVIALTLRYDRLDNFWFTLCHELAHVALHLDRNDVDAFFDDLAESGSGKCEREADVFAAEALIPSKHWKGSGLASDPSREGVLRIAEELRISAAIPAGRIRFEQKDYTVFKDLVGSGHIRRLFEV
jgi:HTH-type transcriptional regulator / antitoxin HigA